MCASWYLKFITHLYWYCDNVCYCYWLLVLALLLTWYICTGISLVLAMALSWYWHWCIVTHQGTVTRPPWSLRPITTPLWPHCGISQCRQSLWTNLFRQADACRGIQMTNKYQPGLKFGWRVETQEAHVGIYCKEQSGCNFVYSWQSPREGYDLYFVLANTFCVKILFMGVH